MKKVVSVSVMRESDRKTIEAGTPSKTLMYRAGEGVFKSWNWSGKTCVVCGSGNNAGDGYVIALLLKEHGFDCEIFLLGESFSEDGRYYFDKCEQAKIKSIVCDEKTDFSAFDTIVDCIFGTGFHGSPTGIAKEIIEKINASGAKVVSVDINSGLNGNSGMGEIVVRSDLTVSIGTLKTGHFLNMAKDCMKKVENCDIGIEIAGDSFNLFEADDAAKMFGRRKFFSHKGIYGYTAVIGGCLEYSGAVKLANMSSASLKSGCGVTKLAVGQSVAAGVLPYLLESTLFPMPDDGGKMIFAPDKIDALLANVKSAAIGMGWGESEEYEKILCYILKNFAINLVIDADGLNTLAKMDKELLNDTKCTVILTPHMKEFERISGYSKSEILNNSINCVREFAKKYSVTVLLKGTATVTADENECYIVDRGCAGMASAGSGDVLSGILAGIGGYMEFCAKTAALGAYIAGISGEEAEREVGAIGMTASDTLRHIPSVIKKLSL